MAGFYDVVRRELSQLEFERVKGGKGSHEKWRSRITGQALLVPRKMKSRHTANAILKDAGSEKKL